MYKLYCKFRDKKGYKDSDVSRLTGIPASTFSDWKRGRSKPNTEKLIKIADCLDTLVEYLSAQNRSIITCPDCGLSYCADVDEDLLKHNQLHNAWVKAEEKFGTIYGNYAIREKIKAKNRIIRDNKSFSLEERCQAELTVLRCLFSRSVEASGYSLKHITYEEYVSKILANKKYISKVDRDIVNTLIDRYGVSPGIDSGTYYHVPSDEQSTLAARFDGEEYTEDELNEIRQFAEFVKTKRKSGL